jgi:hypothetical protein
MGDEEDGEVTRYGVRTFMLLPHLKTDYNIPSITE